MIVALTSVRGAPGVSAWSVLLAAAWPQESGLERVVLEADIGGGVAGARYDLGVEPGAQTLIAGLRNAGDPTTPLIEAGRRVADGAWVVPGPETAEAAHALWTAERAASAVARSLAEDISRVWLCDLGRCSAHSPTIAIVNQAATTLVLCGHRPEDLVQVPSRVEAFKRCGASVAVAVVGSPMYKREELTAFFQCERTWLLPRHPELVDVSRAAWTSQRSARRSPVWRTALALAAEVSDHVGSAIGAEHG